MRDPLDARRASTFDRSAGRGHRHGGRTGHPGHRHFPVTDPAKKTPDGEEATNPDNLICRAVRAVKSQFGDRIGVICDVALDPYTTHGQDGLVRDGYVVNDETIEVLCQQALVQAQAGCDVIAPSDMMDGRVGAIRQALDETSLNTCPRSWPTRPSTLGFLRSVSRCRRVGSQSRYGRQAHLSNGPGQYRRSAARSCHGHRRRR